MGRWQPDAKGRLAQAAFALFEERGFEATTVADIAARAGLTKRTFFRYFGDKREVLFAGATELEAHFVEAVATAPADHGPLDAIAAGLDATADLFAAGGDFPRRRQVIIAANPELRERELIKLAALAAAGAAALRDRGVTEPGAGLAAEAGMAVLRTAFERWTEGPDGAGIHALIHESLAELRAVAQS
jgi:AcrR family transcriptional regulator